MAHPQRGAHRRSRNTGQKIIKSTVGCGKEAKLGQSEVPVTVCHCPWGDVNQCPLTPDREPATDQCKQTADIQLGEPVSLIGVLTGVRGRVTHRSRNESRTAAFLKARPSG